MICPTCGARLDLDPCAVVDEPVSRYLGRVTRRARLAAVAFCPRCEYCAELRGKAVRTMPEPA